MNYFELHIGDYDKATAHLTACEDGIYGRLMRRYYDTETPLPDDLKAIQRFVRARSRDEKEAVQTILDEFFTLQSDGWHHKRCDEEIARFTEKREKAKRSANARWSQPERNANASAEAMRTHCEGNALQTPDTSNAVGRTEASTQGTTGKSTEAGRACRLMREAGCVQTNPSHPNLLAALAEGVSPEELRNTVAEAIIAGKAKPFAWAIQTARSRHAEGVTPLAAGPPRTASRSTPSKTLQGLQALQELAHGNARLDPLRDQPRLDAPRDAEP
jgi:uncharacterized protein YdaU (DUF1376 family)